MVRTFFNEDHYYFTSWQQTHGTLFQAIKLEKRLISLMLFLIITVAAFNILSTLVMTVKDKGKRDSYFKNNGLLKASTYFYLFKPWFNYWFLGTFIGLL